MQKYHKIVNDSTNYAIESNVYLEAIKNEDDSEKKYMMLKKYFTEKITRNLYQNMDLLFATKTNMEEFAKMHKMISKDLQMNMLLAVDTLVDVRKIYKLDPIISTYDKMNNKYTICESMI